MTVHTPVAFLIFRRPDTTQRVFEAIAEAKPTHLFIIADGPRTADDAEKCAQTRAVVETINWECEVKRNYSKLNLGVKNRVVTGLNWAFEQTEELIILEDDCLPNQSFFRFCEELLARYRDHSNVMHISGDYFHGSSSLQSSYYFSRYPHGWGWATWRRAWQHFDENIRAWTEEVDQQQFLTQFKTSAERRFWKFALNAVQSGIINSWDYQWAFACMLRKGLAINPTTNLVANIGFGGLATHTSDANHKLANILTSPIDFPLKHPQTEVRDASLDARTASLFFSQPNVLQHTYNRIHNRISRMVSLKRKRS